MDFSWLVRLACVSEGEGMEKSKETPETKVLGRQEHFSLPPCVISLQACLRMPRRLQHAAPQHFHPTWSCFSKGSGLGAEWEAEHLTVLARSCQLSALTALLFQLEQEGYGLYLTMIAPCSGEMCFCGQEKGCVYGRVCFQ